MEEIEPDGEMPAGRSRKSPLVETLREKFNPKKKQRGGENMNAASQRRVITPLVHGAFAMFLISLFAERLAKATGGGDKAYRESGKVHKTVDFKNIECMRCREG